MPRFVTTFFLAALAACSTSTAGGEYPRTPCAAEGFTACVDSCAETDAVVGASAECVDGFYTCTWPLIPAAACPVGAWTVDGSPSCGPWVEGRDCGCQPVCQDRAWVCPALSTCGSS